MTLIQPLPIHIPQQRIDNPIVAAITWIVALPIYAATFFVLGWTLFKFNKLSTDLLGIAAFGLGVLCVGIMGCLAAILIHGWREYRKPRRRR